MIRRLTVILFHTLLLIVPLFFTTVNDELFEFNKIIVVYIFTAMIVGTWIIRMIADNVVYWKRTPFDLPIGLFLLSQIISTIFSIHTHTSLFGYYTRFNGGLVSILCYITLYYAFVNSCTKKDVAAFLGTTLYAGMLAALYAFFEHFGHSLSCLFITGNFDVACWIQDVKNRVFGTFGQPNWLAAYLIMLIPFVVVRVMTAWMARRMWSVVWNAILLALFVSTLLFTQSRSGLLGLAAGVGVFVGVVGWNLWRTSRSTTSSVDDDSVRVQRNIALSLKPMSKKERKKLAQRFAVHKMQTLTFQTLLVPSLIIGGIGLGLVLTFGTPLTPSLSTMIASMKPQQQTPASVEPTETKPTGGTQLEVGGTESGAIRSIVWKGAIAVWKRYPIFGSGVETFAYSYYQDRLMEHNLVSEWDFLYNKAHNEFLNYLATTGAIGLFTYLLMIGWVSVWLIKHSTKHPLFAGALLAAYSALHVSNFFGFSTVVVSTLFYLIPALGCVELSDEEVRIDSSPTLRASQWIGIGLTTCVSLYFVILVVNMWRADATYSEAKRLMTANKGEAALKEIQRAIAITPIAQGEFQEELGHIASELSLAAFQQKQSTMSADLGEMAIRASDEMLKLNPRHLNFYKSRARVLLTLSQIAPNLMKEVLNVLTKAQDLAPTDAKLVYNRGLIQDQLGNNAEAVSLLKQAIQMKPNYQNAMDQLKRVEGK